MRKSKKQETKKAKRSKKVGYFLVLFGTDPVDSDNIPEVQGTLDAAIAEAKDMLDEDGDEVTVYELVPRAYVEQPATPDVEVKLL